MFLMKKTPFLFLLVFTCLLTSCNAVLTKMYGLRTRNEAVSDETRAGYAREFGVPPDAWYELDGSLADYLMSTYVAGKDSVEQSKYAGAINNHLQPLQAMYFDCAGQLVSYHVNCYAGGFPNLKWNHDDAFSSFPPASVSPLDTLVSLQDLLPHVKTPAGETPICQSSPADYTVVVMWPVFMGRQSKRLIKMVKKNLKTAPDTLRAELLLVNNDAFQLGMDSIISYYKTPNDSIRQQVE